LSGNNQGSTSIGVHKFDPSDLSPQLSINSYRALIDTGAFRTCLTYHAVGAERLIRHSRTLVKNVHNQNLHGLYFANLGVYTTHKVDGKLLNQEQGYFGFPEPVEVMDIADNDRFDAIIGMDLLGKYDFEFSRTGEFRLFLP
jgi:hypothetical protein